MPGAASSKSLQLREDAHSGVYVEGLIQRQVLNGAQHELAQWQVCMHNCVRARLGGHQSSACGRHSLGHEALGRLMASPTCCLLHACTWQTRQLGLLLPPHPW